MKHPRIAALQELCQRYLAVWQAAWSSREQLEPKARLPHEAQFLPAALELQDTPPSPIPRVTARVLMALFVLVILWAALGKMDIVAVAQGKVVPNARVKQIQALQVAQVAAIHVSDGQRVKAGQLLIELDATVDSAENRRTQEAWRDALLESQRAKALLTALEQHRPPLLAPSADIPAAERQEEQRLAVSQYGELQSRLAALDADIGKRQAELQTTQEVVAKLEQTLPIVKQRAEDYKNLQEKNFISRHGYLEKEQERIERERDLASSRSRMNELRAAIVEGQQQRQVLLAEFKRNVLTQQADAEHKAAQLQQERIKTQSREQLTRLTAPVDGAVQQLAVHTVGGVVTAAQVLMIVVPKDMPLEVEAWVENKDIGFVYAQQPATVKIETFPYTKYGAIDGQVLTVSDDAVSDEKRGLLYQARVLLKRSKIQVEGKQVNLSPGMAVTVEIKTGQRRIIDYFLSPLLQYADESLKER